MKKNTTPIPFAGSQLDETRHVCAFFNSDDEEFRVLLPFIRDWFQCGHKAVRVVNVDQRQEHLRRSAAAGIDAAAGAERATGASREHRRLRSRWPLLSIVDDDESVRESLPDLIREFGFAAQPFSSAEEVFLVRFCRAAGLIDESSRRCYFRLARLVKIVRNAILDP